MSPPRPGPRRPAPTRWPMVAVLTLVGIGLGLVALGSWRGGVELVAAGVLLAAGLRVVLPDQVAGMLRVRRKEVDVTVLTALGLGILVLAVVIPQGAV